MATLNRAAMITLTLRRLSVLALGQEASASNSALVGPLLDSYHDQLRGKGLANYPTSAFPEWVQELFAKAMGEVAGPFFGKPRPGAKDEAEREMTEQLSAKPTNRQIRFSEC